MSAIVLKRNYQLEMPKNYVNIESEEMEYVEGGANKVDYWWGWAVDLNNEECKTMAGLLDLNLGMAGFAAAMGSKIPGIGGEIVVATAIYSLGIVSVKTALMGAYNQGMNATLSKNFVGYSVDIW